MININWTEIDFADDLDLESFGKKKKKKKTINMKELEEALPDDKADVSLPNFVSKVTSSLIQL